MNELQTQALRRLLGASACLCFALQPLLVPLHLALEDHTPDASRELVEDSAVPPHSHAGHDHDHPHPHDHDRIPERSEPDGHHPTHPADDHVEDLPDPVTSPVSVALVALALLPAPLELFEPFTLSKPFASYDAPPPRPPPKRVASPRAPPVVA